jgi:ABC-type cobalamin/Fe3+-siderophores transport system ATPase subunit
MDEPDADLDLSGLAILDSTIKSMSGQGTTLVISTHDIQRVSHLADHIVVVAEQKVLTHGDVRSVINSAVLSTAYGVPVEVEWGDRGVTHISISG